MKYDQDIHSIKCPKCGHGMTELTLGGVVIDRCTECHGLWFDPGEEEELKKKWTGHALDIGDPAKGRKWDKVEDYACPHCGKDMIKTSDPDQIHIWYEMCPEHGLFMDAGEFTDYKHETLLDRFRSRAKGERP